MVSHGWLITAKSPPEGMPTAFNGRNKRFHHLTSIHQIGKESISAAFLACRPIKKLTGNWRKLQHAQL